MRETMAVTTTRQTERNNGNAKQPVPLSTHDFVRSLGVPDLPARTSPLDPGYDVKTLVSHLEQSHHLISRLKLSTAQWLIADEEATREKIAAARRLGVPLVTGGTPFEVSQIRGRLDAYFELCVSLGIDRIEIAEGFTHSPDPRRAVSAAARYGLSVQAEVGEKHSGAFDEKEVQRQIARGQEWLDAGASQIIVEARESAKDIGLFDGTGELNLKAAEAFVDAFGMDVTVFEAPNKKSQFDLLIHFGKLVHLSNVRLEEILRVEIYRRGLHADSYSRELAPLPVPGDSK